MSTNVSLSPELERFAHECVAGGRYASVSEVVRSALRLLQDVEDKRHEFRRMIEVAAAEADRDGTVTIESVLAESDATVSDSGD
jgi:antitoxin ParD1/3/4